MALSKMSKIDFFLHLFVALLYEAHFPKGIKGALDKFNIIPNFFQKSWDFYTIRSVGMGNDCMPSFTF